MKKLLLLFLALTFTAHAQQTLKINNSTGALLLTNPSLATFKSANGLGSGGSIATDTLWDAAGDLAVGTGADTAAKLSIGTALQVLRVNAGATALEWGTPSTNAATVTTVTDTADSTAFPVFTTASGTQSLALKSSPNLRYDAANQLFYSAQLGCDYIFFDGNVWTPSMLPVTASGVSVNTSGTTVTGTGIGTAFPTPGEAIILAGVPYVVDSVTNANAIELTLTAGTQTAVQAYAPTNGPTNIWEAIKVDGTPGITLNADGDVTVGNYADTTAFNVASSVVNFLDNSPVASQIVNLAGAVLNIGKFGDTTSTVIASDGTWTHSGSLVLPATDALLLGSAGSTVGNITFRNATSGSIALAPVAGALGTVTISLPAATGTIALTTDITGGTKAGSFATLAASRLASFGATQSAAAWTTTGIGFNEPAYSYTDTSSSGTVAVTTINNIAQPTLLASSATTYTDSFVTRLAGPPVASTNVTQTRAHTLGILDSTSAASSITGGLVVATAFGTTATSVGIGGGSVYAGTSIVSSGLVQGQYFRNAAFIDYGDGGTKIAKINYNGGQELSALKLGGTTTGMRLTMASDGNVTLTDSAGTASTGNLTLNNLIAGGSTTIGSGTAMAKVKHGTAVLAAGTITVSDAATVETGTAATSSRIFVNRIIDGGTLGDSFSITRVTGTSFTITSKTANATASSDTSTVAWLMINP